MQTRLQVGQKSPLAVVVTGVDPCPVSIFATFEQPVFFKIKLINNLLWFLSVGDVLGGVKVGRDLLSMSLAMVVGL